MGPFDAGCALLTKKERKVTMLGSVRLDVRFSVTIHVRRPLGANLERCLVAAII